MLTPPQLQFFARICLRLEVFKLCWLVIKKTGSSRFRTEAVKAVLLSVQTLYPSVQVHVLIVDVKQILVELCCWWFKEINI